MNQYLYTVVILTFMLFVQIQSDNSTMESTTSISEISSSTMMTEWTSDLTSLLTSTVTSPMSTGISQSTHTVTSGTETHAFNSSIEHLSSLLTSTGSTGMTSQMSTIPTGTNINLTYTYVIDSSSPLKTGPVTNMTILSSVVNMVKSSFNLTNFTITVLHIEIRSKTKSLYEYSMITDNHFQSNHIICDTTCISNTASLPTESFKLPDENGILVNVTARSRPTLVENKPDITTTTAINHPKGESPPGTAAKLGMGFGISIIGILLIAEIFYFYRKYGFTRTTQQLRYELPSYNHRSSA